MGEIASALGSRAEEASLVADLKAGSEQAFEWLVARFHQPIYSLVARIVRDPADAADTTQEVFLKVYRGIGSFHGDASLKTWIYRIAIREAANQRRWWFRHKRRETSMEGPVQDSGEGNPVLLVDTLADAADSPFDCLAHNEARARVEIELRRLPEPYRTAVVLRDIEELSYEEVAEVLGVSLGTVKSRLMRGRDALRKRLQAYVQEAGGLNRETSTASAAADVPDAGLATAAGKLKASEAEVMP
ncbi:MAG: RNA polymerase sigma factor [Terriglobales bacterium]